MAGGWLDWALASFCCSSGGASGIGGIGIGGGGGGAALTADDEVHAAGLLLRGQLGDEPQHQQTAARMLRRHADGGHVGAMVALGECYERGSGVGKDAAAAVAWYRKAAARGDVGGMFYLGNAYHRGDGGVARDDAEAVRWYRRAAEGGLATAMVNLGMCYKYGWGVAVDEPEAARLFESAANAGSTFALGKLLYCYMNGTGVPKDTRRALSLARHLAELDNTPQSAGHLARALHAVGNDAAAVKVLERVADVAAPDDDVFCQLGAIYHHGRGVPADPARAVDLYRRADCRDALLGLAVCYELGDGVAADLAEAARLYQQAAGKECKVARARCVEAGWGNAPSPDPAAAMALYAAIQDDDYEVAAATARFFEGRRYELGWAGVAPDLDAARRSYARGAALGSIHARTAVARLDAAAPGGLSMA